MPPPSVSAAVTFLSTSPAWGTTIFIIIPPFAMMISIHVPRVGDDALLAVQTRNEENFYPRPPRGGRHSVCYTILTRLDISIHVPRVGDDSFCVYSLEKENEFLSTSPAWGTT